MWMQLEPVGETKGKKVFKVDSQTYCGGTPSDADVKMQTQ